MTEQTTTSSSSEPAAQAAATESAPATQAAVLLSNDAPQNTDAPAPSAGDGGEQGAGQGDSNVQSGQGEEAAKEPAEAKEGENAAQQPAFELDKLKLPEGFAIDKDLAEKLSPILQAKGHTQEDVQALTDAAATMVSKAVMQMHEQHQQQVQKWHDETVAEHGKGGEEELKKKIGVAQGALDKFFSPDFKAYAVSYGIVNHPEFFSHLYNLGLQTADDGISLKSSGTAPSEMTLEQVWYPTKPDKE